MNTLLLAQRTDLFSRLDSFAELFPAWVLLFALAGLLASLQLALSRNAFWLIPIYLMMCMFSGHTIRQLDTGTTLFRWWLIFCFCVAALKIGKYPGPICIMLGCYWLFSLFSVLWSPNFSGGIQLSGLNLLMNFGASYAISGLISSPSKIKKTITLYCLMSVFFIANGFVSIGNISGARFAGAMGEAVGLFVITGGLLMPALLWAFLSHPNYNRYAAAIAFTLTTTLCVLSGQRAGFFAGVIGCFPLLFQLNAKFFSRALIISIAVVAAFIFTLQLFPIQTKFIAERYFEIDRNGNMSFSTNTTGREALWKQALDRTIERPILGHGASAHQKSEVEGFHNAYLQEWYNGGIIGLFLFFGASVLALIKTFRLTQSIFFDEETRQMSRLLFSWMIVLFLVSFFESKLSSPSNIMTFTMVLVGVMTHRLEACAKSNSNSLPQARY